MLHPGLGDVARKASLDVGGPENRVPVVSTPVYVLEVTGYLFPHNFRSYPGFLQTCQNITLNWATTASFHILYNLFSLNLISVHAMYGHRVSLLGVKRPGCGIDHPPSSNAEVKERVALYPYSPSAPLWPVLGWTSPFPFTTICTLRSLEHR